MCLLGDIDETKVYLHPLPIRVRAFVTRDEDCRYTIVINENLSYEKRTEALLHELQHVQMGHLFSEEPVYSIERGMSIS